MPVHASMRMIGTPHKRGEACSFRTLCARARARVGIVQGRGIVVQAGIVPQNFAGIMTDTALFVGLVAYTSAKPAKPSAKPSAKPAKPSAKPSVAKEKRKPQEEIAKEETERGNRKRGNRKTGNRE